MMDRPSYLPRRKICRDYYKATRKGWLDRFKASLRKDDKGADETCNR